MSNNADEFLEFVASNQKRLRHNLRKNITYDAELFEDVFEDTIIKCYDSIVARNLTVKSFENFFFLASKNNYIQAQNKKRRRTANSIDIDDYKHKELPEFAEEETEEEENPAIARVNKICDTLTEYFGQNRASLFLEYFRQKCAGNLDIPGLSGQFGYPEECIKSEVMKMKSFLKKFSDDKYLKSYSLF